MIYGHSVFDYLTIPAYIGDGHYVRLYDFSVNKLSGVVNVFPNMSEWNISSRKEGIWIDILIVHHSLDNKRIKSSI